MIEQVNNANILGQDQIRVTDAARTKITELIADAGDSIDAVRVFISGGGCSGMNYGMTFSEKNNSLDSILEGSEGFRIVVDPFALAYMEGAEIDYSEEGANATFVFNNVFQSVGGSGSCGGCGSAH
tara:strand:+ start:274 stop:651 length:378 start_codon:yes stop_codon:yes gene_type:complete